MESIKWMISAAEQGDFSVVHKLLEHEVDANVADENGNGVDVNLQAGNGSTPLLCVARKGYTDVAQTTSTTEQSGDEENVGAIRWKAPEVIREDKPMAPNAQSDVYSFGMCVVEAVTVDVPWGQRVPDPVVKLHVTRRKFLPRPKAFVNDAQWELVEKLCAFEPSERLKLLDAIELIRGFAEEERFQERLHAMQKEDSEDLKDGEIEDKVSTSGVKTMGSIRALVTMKSIGHSIRARKEAVLAA